MNNDNRSQDGTIFVLVHGSWHGAWCWSAVAEKLRASGFEVFTPTLAGLGERAGELAVEIDLESHINDVMELILREDLRKVVLVGHSYAGIVISAVADRSPERLDHLIFLDALLLENGESVVSRWMSPEQLKALDMAAPKEELTHSVPPPPAELFDISDPDQRAWVNSRLTPQPLGTYLQPLYLSKPIGAGLPKTYIDCAKASSSILASLKSTLAKPGCGWDYRSVPHGHDIMITAPDILSRLLQQIAAGR